MTLIRIVINYTCSSLLQLSDSAVGLSYCSHESDGETAVWGTSQGLHLKALSPNWLMVTGSDVPTSELAKLLGFPNAEMCCIRKAIKPEQWMREVLLNVTADNVLLIKNNVAAEFILQDLKLAGCRAAGG